MTTDRGNRDRKRHVCKRTGKCDRCPMHARDNQGRTPRPDKYKNKRGAK